jgi:hypothetical protein
MRGADPVRAEVRHSRLTQRRAEGVELALPDIAQFEPIRSGQTKRVPCPHLIGI